jgi:hypothetical protein
VSAYSEYVVGRRTYGRKTETAGTIIRQLIEPMKNAFTRIVGVTVKTGATAHILTLLRPCNRTYFTADAAASQAVVNVAADPGDYPSGVRTADNAIAANDVVVYEASDGTYVLDTVSSVSSLAVTLATNLPTGGVKENGLLWWFGIVTDTNPNDGMAHPRWNLDASTTTSLGRGNCLTSIEDHRLMDVGRGMYQPLVLSVDNGTNASIIESTGVEYVRRGK